MYRNNDLTAAFGRAQFTRRDDYLATQKVNAARLTECLEEVPHLMLPGAPDDHGHTYYNYTVRFDMKSLDHAADPAAFRAKLVKALQAEGVATGVWQGWPLPAMTVFQAKNAYGKGCPWSCPNAQAVNYDPAQYPVARKHSDWHTGMTVPLRAPNGPGAADLVAKAFAKVMQHVEQVEKVEA